MALIWIWFQERWGTTADEDRGGGAPVELVSLKSHLPADGLDVSGNARRLSRVGVEVAVRADVGAERNVDVDAKLVVHLGRGVE